MKKLPTSALSLFGEMMSPFKGRIAAFFLLTLLGISCWVASPFAVRSLINDLVKHHVVSHTAWILVGVFVLLRLGDEWFWRFAEDVMRRMKPSMVERMRTILFEHTLNRPYNFFVNASSGQLGHWINQTNSTINETIDTTIWGVWPRVATLVLSAGFLMLSHWSLALVFVVWIGGLMIYTVRRGRKFGQLVELESDARSEASGQVVDALSNHVSVRVFNAQNHEMNLLRRKQQTIIDRWNASWRYHLTTNRVKGHSVALAGGVAMSIILLLFGRGLITIGDVALFIAYFTDASSSIWELAWQLDSYYRSFGTIQNALNGLNVGKEERTTPSAERLPKEGRIVMKNLRFSYPDQADDDVLRGIDLEIKAGERVGLVGHSGAGKTTLVGLLLGFYEPTGGQFEIDGTEIEQLSPVQMRELIAFVPQDTNLFNRTITTNIAYAKPSATEKEIHDAAKGAQAVEFIKRLPHGFGTVIGERGVKLSGGQRQRIAIARALLKDAPILVLDEATSALDSVSEQAIQKAFSEAMKGRTAVVVAHRLSTLKHLNRIIVFDKGKLAEQGTHDELVRLGGIYADLWHRQKGGFLAE